MNIFAANNILFFIVFFVPGFVSIKIYDLLVPNESRDFNKSFFDALAYSAVNLGLWLWLLKLTSGTGWFWLILFLSLLVSPILLTLGYLKILRSKFLAKHLVNPVRRPWDWFFRQKKSIWVIVNFVNGNKIGGKFSSLSYASSFPLPEQIYIEQIWKLGEDGTFQKPVENSAGAILLGKDISFIEFLDGSEVKNDP